MATITSGMVRDLREKTGAGMMDCKQALEESGGNFDQAIEILRKRGLKDLSKKAGKVAAEGTIGVYAHPGDRVVALVELNCQTDFVARGDDFRALARDIALHVAAMRPLYVSVDEIPANIVEKEKEIIVGSLEPAQRAKADKIIPGKLEKWYQDSVLLKQPFVKDDSGKKTIGDLIDELGIKTGEKIAIRRFSRYEVGEGVVKESVDYAADVAATVAAVQGSR